MANTPATTSSVPQLRGLNNAFIKRHLIISLGLTAVATVAYKMLVNDPRKQAYADFYKKYDAEKSFQRMKAAGVFQAIDA